MLTMDRYLLQEHYASLVRQFKDSEKEFDQEGRDSELLTSSFLTIVRYSRFRQYKLFTQKRGEEFERVIALLEKEHDPDAIKRFLENDELWATMLELAEQ
jgi:hypothetical protein